MNNLQIAKILMNISLILDMKGDNRFKVLAYEKAADTILNLPHEVDDLYKEGGYAALEKIENVGESIAQKIEELIKTGKMKAYADLLKQVPESVLEMTQVPGIGPKTAWALFKKLKIDSVKKLEQAAKAHQIAGIEHFKEKSEENILRGIEQYGLRTKERNRMIITQAEPIALEIINYLKRNKSVTQCEAVGSLRRMKETIGDIDIVVATAKPKQIIDDLSRSVFVKNILAHGDTKLSFTDKHNVRIDLEILPAADWGSLLQHFTGSKEHNVALRTWASSRDLKISEYGITNLKTKKESHFTNEHNLYSFLGMQYIEPELREDAGEIEAALRQAQGKLPGLPKIIGYNDIKGDLHTHTDASDGANSIGEMIKAAKDLGYEYYGMTDHTVGLGVARGLNDKALLKHKTDIYKEAKKFKGIKVLAGAEVNIRADGKLDISDKTLAQLDYAIGSIHSAFNQDKTQITKRLLSAINNLNIRIIGHPTGRILGHRSGYEADWVEIFKACAKNKVALEINAYPNRLDLRDVMVKEAIKYGCKLIINTDSHHAESLTGMRYGIAVARRGWATKTDIVNTWDIKKFLEWLKI